MKLKDLEYRTIALQQLKSHIYQLLNEQHSRNKIIFKAPTGSGKTVTMACLLRDLVNELPNKFELPNRNIAYIWIAPNALHLQSYQSLKSFFDETKDIRTIQFEDIVEDQLQPNELLFLNWQSISSEDNLFVRDNENDKNLYNYISNTKQSGTDVIVILDEAHLFGTKGEKAQNVLTKLDAKIEIDVTATPLIRSDYEVIIRRADVVKEQMIKKGVNLNPKLDVVIQGERDANLVLLQQALEKRDELAEKYRNVGTKINPLLLIQLPSDIQRITQTDNEIKQLVIDYLQMKGITQQNNRLAVWLSNEKINLEDISTNENIVDVLLFKQAIALGWDCPRASILLVYREMKQETFTVQTLGRILRMPEQKHYVDEALNIGYVFTNLERDLIEIVADETDYLTFNKSMRKPIYNNLNLTSYYKESTLTRNRLGLHFREALFNIAENLFDIKQEAENGNSFYFINKERMESKTISMEVKDIQIAIPSDVMIDVTQEGSTEVAHKAKFAKTSYQLEQLFNRFCLNNCGEYQKDGSWERIKHHLKLLFEEYLGLDEKETYKIILHNEQAFTDLLNLSREEYARIMAAKAKATTTDVKEYLWEVPEFRIYNNLFTEYGVEKTILDPLFLRQNAGFLSDSKNEFEFINYLEKCQQEIVWWYKNGIGSKTDFAISYNNSKNQRSLFFVDFVILFSNGTLGLFDPKTENSDPDIVAKHNALNDYVISRNQEGKTTIGGVTLPKNGSWRYSKNKLKNGYDVEGWDVFNPLLNTN
jgi:type III restriction enzyme